MMVPANILISAGPIHSGYGIDRLSFRICPGICPGYVLGQVVHEGRAAEFEVEGRAGRVGRAVDEDQRAVRCEARRAGGMLVADVDVDARLAGGEHFR